jgi:hypothetical protein
MVTRRYLGAFECGAESRDSQKIACNIYRVIFLLPKQAGSEILPKEGKTEAWRSATKGY